MPHLVDIMAYTNQRPWWLGIDGVHGFDGQGEARYLGNEAVDSATMMRMAFPRRDGKPGVWHVEKRNAGFERREGEYTSHHGFANDAWKRVPGEYFLVRNDDLMPLGRCKDKYEPFQIDDVFSFMDSLLDERGLRYHTAGSIMFGKKIWALAQMPGEFVVRRSDGSLNHHVPFILMTAGHDGTTGIWIMGTDVRAECWNTVTWAEREAEENARIFGIPHTASAREKVAEAKLALDLMTENERMFAEVAKELAQQRMTHDEFSAFASAIVLDLECTMAEADETVREAREKLSSRSRVILDNKVAKLQDHFEDRAHGNLGSDRYDALNAVTQGYDHRAIEERYAKAKEAVTSIQRYSRALDSSWFGTGASRKRRALRMLGNS